MKYAVVIWVSIFICHICFGQASLNNGLVLHLPFDGNTNDVSGNTQTVKPRNIRFDPNCSGMPGSAAYFNGVNSLIEIPPSPALNTTEKLTISFWVKTENATSSTVLLSRAKRLPGEDPRLGYELGFNNFRQPLFSLITPPLCHIYTNWVSDGKPMASNTWTSIIAIFDGIQMSIYVNGVLVGQSFTSFDKLLFCEADLPLFLGALFAEEENTLKGWMDELRIYSRAVTEEEIRILSNTCTINTFCQAPSDLTVNGNSASSILMNWKASGGNSQFISEYRPVGSPNWLPGFKTSNTNANITGLQTGTTYELRLRAICAATDSSGWKPGIYTLLGDTRCDAPFNLQVGATGETSASLTWEALPAGIGVNIQYAEAGTGNWVDAASEITDRSYTLTGLNPGTAYEWRVQTACNLGPSTWVISNFTTTGVSPCRPPTGLLPFDLSGNRAALKWNPWAESQYFEVEYKLSTSSTWIRASSQNFSADRIYIDSLQPLTAYQWRVRTLCNTGTSEWVNGDFITTPGRPIDAGVLLVADFLYTTVNCKPADISFKNSSIVTRTNMSTIQWSFGDGKISTVPEPVHTYEKPGVYNVSLTIGDDNGRTSAKTQQVTITSTSLRIALSSGDLTACSNEPITLRAEGGVKYEWFPCIGLSDCNTATPTVIPGMHDRYTVKVTDQNGCTDTTGLTVRYVDPARGIHIPNIFTPNGDGLNDGFSPLAQVVIPGNHEVRIFDRFGSVILSSSKKDIRWDGTIKGKPAPTGNYSYLVRIRGEGSCASKDIKGTVMLVR